ncbi:helix-turn-helix domain-containing protein [Nonomuraea sp. NPDC049750]|uniref:helix-turn-helix transcriptional regulator n=1 Tax=Nonomuraea sp. NPDC049750 TaxID=3154738 RepID=UPI00340F75D9
MSGTRLTFVFELRTEPAIEKAIGLVERWVCDELDIETPLRALSVASVRISGEGLPLPEPGVRLAERRQRLNLTQQTVARRAGISRTAVVAVERGDISGGSKSAIAVRRTLDAAEAEQ